MNWPNKWNYGVDQHGHIDFPDPSPKSALLQRTDSSSDSSDVLLPVEYTLKSVSGNNFTDTFKFNVKKPQVCALDVQKDTRCDDARTLLFGNKTSVGQICSIADTVIDIGKGQELQNIGGGLCLDVDVNQLKADGATVQAWSCNGAPQQQWTLDANGALRNGGGLCLDVDMSSGPSAIRTNGINVQIWSCNDALQQAWKFNTNGDKLLPDNMPGTCCLDNVKTLQNFGDQVRYS